MAERPRGFSIQTRCETVESFIERFAERTSQKSIFVPTFDPRVVGTECGFAILLANKRPALAGTCVVLEAFPDANNLFKRPGMRLQINRLGAGSEPVFAALEAARELKSEPPAPPPAPPPMPAAVAVRRTQAFRALASVQIPPREEPSRAPRATSAPTAPASVPTPVVAEGSRETRTPGSPLVLPANPLMHMTDSSLEGLVECRLYEAPTAIALHESSEPVAAPAAPAPTPVVDPEGTREDAGLLDEAAYITDKPVRPDGADEKSAVPEAIAHAEPTACVRSRSHRGLIAVLAAVAMVGAVVVIWAL